ncbi:unnamed protein product [Ostreobium quekettii]|uniref:Uncharacterized protein n=1 Tax=Ostreobium quekettii TaxID=121088 RepID=A0A8S1IYC8_9CHLO|nr:unnamed protein product [Ostreobium quekettii]
MVAVDGGIPPRGGVVALCIEAWVKSPESSTSRYRDAGMAETPPASDTERIAHPRWLPLDSGQLDPQQRPKHRYGISSKLPPAPHHLDAVSAAKLHRDEGVGLRIRIPRAGAFGVQGARRLHLCGIATRSWAIGLGKALLG